MLFIYTANINALLNLSKTLIPNGQFYFLNRNLLTNSYLPTKNNRQSLPVIYFLRLKDSKTQRLKA